jgi:hypothetical protein
MEGQGARIGLICFKIGTKGGAVVKRVIKLRVPKFGFI